MPRKACTFKQSDVTRALKAARKAGADVARVEIDRQGKIVIVMGKPSEASEVDANPWDDWAARLKEGA